MFCGQTQLNALQDSAEKGGACRIRYLIAITGYTICCHEIFWNWVMSPMTRNIKGLSSMRFFFLHHVEFF